MSSPVGTHSCFNVIACGRGLSADLFACELQKDIVERRPLHPDRQYALADLTNDLRNADISPKCRYKNLAISFSYLDLKEVFQICHGLFVVCCLQIDNVTAYQLLQLC